MDNVCNEKTFTSDCIVFYGTPAYGHINPTIPIIKKLADEGFRVVYYATEEFRNRIEACGAEFRPYNFGDIKFSTQIGSEILNLTELILRFTYEQLDDLLEQAKELNPSLIMHDTIAFWGRSVSKILDIKAASVNTFLVAYKYTSKTFMLYFSGFAGTGISEITTLPGILKYKRLLKKRYSLNNLDILGILMNQEDLNILTYPKTAHPDSNALLNNCFFLGASTLMQKDKSDTYEAYNTRNLIYVSLGTIFNSSSEFWKAIFSAFDNSEYNVLISCGNQYEQLSSMNIPKNIVLKRYVNQRQVLKHSILFISAGGINSVCEAIANSVPCLFCPQQNEQVITSKIFEKLGLGKILKDYRNIFSASKCLIESFKPNYDLIKEFSNVRMDELVIKIKKYMIKSEK